MTVEEDKISQPWLTKGVYVDNRPQALSESCAAGEHGCIGFINKRATVLCGWPPKPEKTVTLVRLHMS